MPSERVRAASACRTGRTPAGSRPGSAQGVVAHHQDQPADAPGVYPAGYLLDYGTVSLGNAFGWAPAGRSPQVTGR